MSDYGEQHQDSGLGLGIRIYLGPRNGAVVDPVEPIPPPLPPIVEVPDLPTSDPGEPEPPSGIWSYNIHNFQNGGCSDCGTWTNDEKVRMNAGAWVAEKVMNDPASGMEAKVKGNGCGYQVSGSSYYYGSVPCGTFIWNDIYAANDKYWSSESGGVDNQADVKYLRVKTNCSFIGSASVPSNAWNICRPVYNSNNYSPASTAGNMMHEWSHTMGYGHCGSCSTRSQTIPYRLGQYAREEGLQFNSQAQSLFPRNW